MRSSLFISLFSCFLAAFEGKVLTKCETAQELKAQGMDGLSGYSLAEWVCVAEHKSGFNTQAFHGENADGSCDYGIFQLSDSWCKNSQHSSKNVCNVSCSKFLDSDISNDILCVKTAMTDPEASSAWATSIKHCKSKDLSKYLASCKL